MAKNLMEVGLQYPLFQEEAAPVNSVNDQKKSVVGGIAVDGFPEVKKSNSCKLVSREFRQEDTVVDVQGVKIGGKHLGIMAGPCAVESQEQLLEAAKAVKRVGAQFLRGGAYKPRSSPYSFQGLEERGLQMLAKAREQTGLKVVTEVMDAAAVGMISQYADVLQIGTRNMQNSNLLRAVGKTDKPVLLKRGMAATISEWLDAAEYIMCEGNHNVILCERGIRTFETYTRNTLDLGAVVAVKRLSHLPVIVDPSHGTGRWKMVRPMACAAVAAGADGLIIEVHPNPDVALCDGKQSLTPENFSLLMTEVGSIAAISGKSILYREK
ncbi:Phospho-2-dehydro-3-deoxyheptonate aldolase [Sporomusa paucivorans]|nr:3-deoxy-7-phosphoheptulonate synthase [Sporomusa sp. GT1]MCM0760881.1 3-deoxy-7-phosphoheptulonate synthase [Sporomusa sphaeroides DSM 2875]